MLSSFVLALLAIILFSLFGLPAIIGMIVFFVVMKMTGAVLATIVALIIWDYINKRGWLSVKASKTPYGPCQ